MNGKFGMRGELQLWLHDKDGNLLEHRGPSTNLIINHGFSNLCKVIGQTLSGKPWYHISVGMNSAVATITNSGIISQAARKKATYNNTTSKQFSLVYTFTGGSLGASAGGGKTMWESGLYNSTAGGICLNRKKITSVAVNLADKLTVQWTIKFTNA